MATSYDYLKVSTMVKGDYTINYHTRLNQYDKLSQEIALMDHPENFYKLMEYGKTVSQLVVLAQIYINYEQCGKSYMVWDGVSSRQIGAINSLRKAKVLRTEDEIYHYLTVTEFAS